MESIKELVNEVLNNKDEEEDQLHDDDRPLTMEDFKKLFQVQADIQSTSKPFDIIDEKKGSFKSSVRPNEA